MVAIPICPSKLCPLKRTPALVSWGLWNSSRLWAPLESSPRYCVGSYCRNVTSLHQNSVVHSITPQSTSLGSFPRTNIILKKYQFTFFLFVLTNFLETWIVKIKLSFIPAFDIVNISFFPCSCQTFDLKWFTPQSNKTQELITNIKIHPQV